MYIEKMSYIYKNDPYKIEIYKESHISNHPVLIIDIPGGSFINANCSKLYNYFTHKIPFVATFEYPTLTNDKIKSFTEMMEAVSNVIEILNEKLKPETIYIVATSAGASLATNYINNLTNFSILKKIKKFVGISGWYGKDYFLTKSRVKNLTSDFIDKMYFKCPSSQKLPESIQTLLICGEKDALLSDCTISYANKHNNGEFFYFKGDHLGFGNDVDGVKLVMNYLSI